MSNFTGLSPEVALPCQEPSRTYYIQLCSSTMEKQAHANIITSVSYNVIEPNSYIKASKYAK